MIKLVDLLKEKIQNLNAGGPGSGPQNGDDEENPFDREPSDDEMADIEKEFEGKINEYSLKNIDSKEWKHIKQKQT